MPECTDKMTGTLLHSYELGLLSEPERTRFELHLVECKHCLDELQSFETASRLLVSNGDVGAVLEQTLQGDAVPGSLLRRVWRRLWPQGPVVFKPAILYALLLALLLPAFYGLQGPRELGFQEFQQVIELTPTRSASVATLRKSVGDLGIITFNFRGLEQAESYHLSIQSEDGTVVYDNPEYGSAGEYGRGSLMLPVSELEPGRYELSIENAQSQRAPTRRVHYFRVTE
jgi:hypothetical protein